MFSYFLYKKRYFNVANILLGNQKINFTMNNTVQTTSNIKGMNLLIIGDSMTVKKIWQQRLVDRYGILDTYNNYCGNGWSVQAVNEQIYRHKHPLDKTRDGVIIFLGTNDAHYIHNQELGSGVTIDGYLEGSYEDSTDLYATSFHASVKLLLETVLKDYVGKPIMWVGSPRRVNAFNTTDAINLKLKHFTEIIRSHCKDYGIKFIDLYNDYNCYTQLGDGIHPTVECYNNIGNVIGNEFNLMC